MITIPFNKPVATALEASNLHAVLASDHMSGDGAFTKKCHTWIEQHTGCAHALLTHSGTAALEMAALAMGIGPGDEVILPSYTFSSTANAFALRGAQLVFVDIREDTLNLDEGLIAQAITPRTKAIAPVHYAGVACDMDAIMALATQHGLSVIEDAAQALGSSYKGKPLGTIGRFGALSFHETKNLISGEGGALLINQHVDAVPCEIIREKGTDRSQFFRGEIDKYTWRDVGSSYLPSELVAAFLCAQLQRSNDIQAERMTIWMRYWQLTEKLAQRGGLRRPVIPDRCTHNAHMFYVLLPNTEIRIRVQAGLKAAGIGAVPHYVPLHSAPAGLKFGQVAGSMSVTNDLSSRLLRLPLWIGLDAATQGLVVDELARWL